MSQRLRNNAKQEIDKLNQERELQKQHLINEAKTRNTPTSVEPKTPSATTAKTFNFFTLLDYNMYVTQVNNDTLTICFFNYNNTFNLTKFYIILDKLNDYIRESLFSYSENYDVKYCIKIKLYFYMDTKKQVSLLKKNILKNRNYFLDRHFISC